MSLHRFLGLKHEFGADPKDGKAADCLLLCFTLLDEAGIYRPEFKPEWMKMAEAGLWQSLETAWNNLTSPVNAVKAGCVALHWNRPTRNHPRLGISTVVEDSGNLGVVMIHARKGVVWLPLTTPGLPQFNFRRFRE
jgi:hypothetical protein